MWMPTYAAILAGCLSLAAGLGDTGAGADQRLVARAPVVNWLMANRPEFMKPSPRTNLMGKLQKEGVNKPKSSKIEGACAQRCYMDFVSLVPATPSTCGRID